MVNGLFFFLRFYFFVGERDSQREGTQAGGAGEEEAGSQRSREPDAGLDSRTLESCPEPKAGA